MTKYTKDSLVSVSMSIENLAIMHGVLYSSYLMEPHNPAKATALFLIQDVVDKMKKDAGLKEILEGLYDLEQIENKILN
jgi:hypothetical protein